MIPSIVRGALGVKGCERVSPGEWNANLAKHAGRLLASVLSLIGRGTDGVGNSPERKMLQRSGKMRSRTFKGGFLSWNTKLGKPSVKTVTGDI